MSSLATSRANISILDVLFVFISICWVWGLCYMNGICIFFFFYIYWCSKRLPYHIMFLSFNSSTTGVTSGAGTFYPQIIQGFIPVHVCQSFVFCRVVLPSQGHYGFHSFPVVDWFCLFIYLWVLTFPLEDCSEFGHFVITLI